MAYPIIRGYLSSPSVSAEDKIRVALEVMKRVIPMPVEHSGSVDGGAQRPIIVMVRTSDGESPALLLGAPTPPTNRLLDAATEVVVAEELVDAHA